MPFNAWLSQKLYCCAEEVVTPQDNKVHQGVLKHYVTGTTLYINDKGIPLRRESNHVNFVFLSNELRPLLIGEHDRRYMVIQYNEEHPKSYFDAIGEEIKQGGIAALLHWLLNYPLEGFDEFTRPIETTAHRELIALGMSAERRFFLCWQAEDTPLPFGCCRAIDLYDAFCIWARINGERFVPNSTTFGTAVGRWVPKKSRRKIPLFDKKAKAMVKTQAIIYFVGEQQALEPAQELQWLSDECQKFHDALWKYRGEAD
jgi:putative DNA primase/helicase